MTNNINQNRNGVPVIATAAPRSRAFVAPQRQAASNDQARFASLESRIALLETTASTKQKRGSDPEQSVSPLKI